MKAITFRLPEDLAGWLRVRAAQETIQRKKYSSISVLAVEIPRREMEADHGPEKRTLGPINKRGKAYWIKYHNGRGKPLHESPRTDKMMVAKKLLKKRESKIAGGRKARFALK